MLDVYLHVSAKVISIIFCFAGDPLLDLIPIYLDVFRGDSLLLEQFLKSYGLPLTTCIVQPKSDMDAQVDVEKFKRISYHAMYVFLDNQYLILLPSLYFSTP